MPLRSLRYFSGSTFRQKRQRRLLVESLEDRRLLAVGNPAWTERGPAVIELAGNIQGIAQNNATGAVQTLLPHPTNPNVLYAGAVNGGVWGTTNATAVNPTWTPLTENMPSMSITALAFSPNDTSRIYAGTGRFSSRSDDGVAAGVFRSTNGGQNWTPLGTNTLRGVSILGLAVAGQVGGQDVVVVGGDNHGDFGKQGLYRSTDSGATWTKLSGQGGLPATSNQDNSTGHVSEIVRSANGTLFAALPGNGVYRSTDLGATWTKTAVLGLPATGETQATRIRLSANNPNVLYAGLTLPVQPSGAVVGEIFRSTDQGVSWTNLGVPMDANNDIVASGRQSNSHFSMVAHPTNPSLLYIGGDRQSRYRANGCVGWVGRHLRGEIGVDQFGNPQTTWTSLDCSAAPVAQQPLFVGQTGSAPHPDSRALVFDAAGNIIEGNDGGVSRLNNPETPAQRGWATLNGTPASGALRSAEFISIGYDNVNNRVVGGTQDNGTPIENPTGFWKDLTGGDGGRVLVDNSAKVLNPQTRQVQAGTIVYASSQNLGDFRRLEYSAAQPGQTPQLLREQRVDPRLTVNGNVRGFLKTDNNRRGDPQGAEQLPFITPIQLNPRNGTNLLIGGSQGIYESFDRGDTVTRVGNAPGVSNVIAFEGTSPNPGGGAAYVGGQTGLVVRPAGGTTFNPTTLQDPRFVDPRVNVIDLAVRPNGWQRVYAVGSAQGQIFFSSDAGQTWANIAGQGGTGISGLKIFSVEVYPRNDGQESVFVGTEIGVFGTDNVNGSNTQWTRFGTAIPSVIVTDLHYDATDNLLFAATLGRGVWQVGQFSNFTGGQPQGGGGMMAPVVDLNGAAAGVDTVGTFRQGNGPQLIVQPNQLTVSDPDSTNLVIASVRLRNATQTESLTANAGNTNLTVQTYNTQTGSLIISGTGTLAEYQQVLSSVRYNNTNPAPASVRAIEFVVSDGRANSNVATSQVSLQTVNTAPAIDLNGPNVRGTSFTASPYTFATPENPVNIAANVATLTSNANIDRLVLTLTTNQGIDLNNDQLNIANPNPNVITVQDNFPTIVVSGSQPAAVYQQILQSVQFAGFNGQMPAPGVRTVQVKAFSGQTMSAQVTSQVTVVAPANATTFGGGPVDNGDDGFFVDWNGNDAAAFPDDLFLNDFDDQTVPFARAMLGNREDGQNELLVVDTAGTNIVADYDPDTGQLMLQGDDSLENYRTVLQSVNYRNTSAMPSTRPRTISFVVNDGDTDSLPFTSTVRIRPDDNAPRVDLDDISAGTEYRTTFGQGSGGTFVTGDFPEISDADSSDLMSATVTILNPEDAIEEQLLADTSETDITANYDSSSHTLSLTGNAPLEDYEEVLATVEYINSALRPTPTTREIEVVINDGTHNSAPAISFVSIDSLPAIPLVDLNGDLEDIDYSTRFLEDAGPVAISSADTMILSEAGGELHYADVQILNPLDAPHEVLTVETAGTNIVAEFDPEFGVLFLDGVDSLANYEAVLKSVRYENRSPSALDTRFIETYVASELVESFAAYSVVEIDSVNDAPILDSNAAFELFPVNEDELDLLGTSVNELLSFPEAFPIEDPDAQPIFGIAVVGADTTHGNWQFSKNAGETWSDLGDVSDSNARMLQDDNVTLLRFVPEQDFVGTVENAITFRAWDQSTPNPQNRFDRRSNGNLADASVNGGASEFSEQTNTASIEVLAVNDPPTFDLPLGIEIEEDAGLINLPGFVGSISSGAANESDQTVSFSVAENTNPGLFSELPSISADGDLTFTTATNVMGTANVTVVARDNLDGTSEPQTFTITATAINDPPEFSIPSAVSAGQRAGTVTLSDFVSDLVAGPADESDQTLATRLIVDDPTLFLSPPVLSDSSTLTFTPASTASGTTLVTLEVTDSGPNDGLNLNVASQTFTITIEPEIDPPPPGVTELALLGNGGVAGEQTVLVNTESSPGAIVLFAVGTEFGTTVVPNLGVTLEISDPVFFAVDTANSVGASTAELFIPPELVGQTVGIQAVEKAPVLKISELITFDVLASDTGGGEGEPITYRRALQLFGSSLGDAASAPHQNLLSINDVNGDGLVVPLDVLRVINAINRDGSQQLPQAAPEGLDVFLDTNGDGFLAPSDVLQIVNFLNAVRSPFAEAEGEAPSGTWDPRMWLSESGPQSLLEGENISWAKQMQESSVWDSGEDYWLPETGEQLEAVSAVANGRQPDDFWESILEQN